MSDWYIEDRTRLQGQPKATIADYVESNGILVPRRFATAKEAEGSGLEIFCRSEHEQEYDGFSGLLRSFKLGEYSAEIIDQYAARLSAGNAYASSFMKILGIDKDQFMGEVSLSFWEKLGGFNRTVIADSAIEGRYHVMSYKPGQGLMDPNFTTRSFINYSIIEDGKQITSYGKDLPQEIVEGFIPLVQTYEQVRQLDKFDPNHCPIMEFQTVDGKDFFLQYHRTRDFDPAKFVLDREPLNVEFEATFVRGKTTPEGIKSARIRIVHEREYLDRLTKGEKLDDSGFDVSSRVQNEILSRNRGIQFIPYNHPNLNVILPLVAEGHTERSLLYKPEISLIIDREKFGEDLPDEIQVDVISDGRRALLRRV